MKPRFLVSLAVAAFILCGAQLAAAQSTNTPAKLGELQEKIKRMEAMDLSSMAPSTLEIYKRTLLRLYENVVPLLQQQIDVLATIESAANTNDREAATAREELAKQKGQATDRLQILKISLGLEEPAAVTESHGADSSATETPQPAPSRRNAVTTATVAPTTSSAAVAPAPPSPRATLRTAAPAAAPAPDVACDTKGFSPVLVDEVNKLAGSIRVNDEQEITSARFKLIFYTIADAQKLQINAPLVMKNGQLVSSTFAFPDLEPYHYLGETMRLDKQMGASSSSSESVSGIDKPGFAWLLGMALENGQVEQDVRNSVLTLSTSPAAVFMLSKESNEDAYKKAGWLNRIGISASFNISDENELLGNVTRSQLKEYSVKYRFLGDRSSRSSEMEDIWNDVSADIQGRLLALNGAAQFISTDAVLSPLTVKTNNELQAAVVALRQSAGFAAKTADEQDCAVSDAILTYLRANVANQQVSPAVVAEFQNVLLPNLAMAQQKLKLVRAAFDAKVDRFLKGRVGTISYINHRESVVGNYSEFKVLYEQGTPILRPLPLDTITANAGFSFYHQPNAALGQERMRAFNAALSFAGSAASPISETLDLSRITYSFVGRYERLFESGNLNGRKNDLASAQFLMSFPLFKGMGVPLSVTYSNATEMERKAGWRINFGLRMDTDKLLELVRAASAP